MLHRNRCELYALCCLSYCNCRQIRGCAVHNHASMPRGGARNTLAGPASQSAAWAACASLIARSTRGALKIRRQECRASQEAAWMGIPHPKCGEQESNRNTRGGLFLCVFTARLFDDSAFHAREISGSRMPGKMMRKIDVSHRPYRATFEDWLMDVSTGFQYACRENAFQKRQQ